MLYLDTAPIIYSVEKHVDYLALMHPVWLASQRGEISLITSELTLLETLVAPIKNGNHSLAAAYERILIATEVHSIPISSQVLRKAANLRAQNNFKTPDAIHAATALVHGCDLFITNDAAFRRISGLTVEVLKDLI